MLLSGFIGDYAVYIAIFTAVLVFSILWYQISVYKPLAKFPQWRLDFRIPYWVLTGKKLDVVILAEACKKAREFEKEGCFVAWAGKPRLVIYGEELVKSILPHTAVKPPVFKVAEFTFGDGIFISNGERWRKQRKLVVPALHTKVLKQYVSFMNNNARFLVRKFSEKKGETIYDICHIISQCTLKLFYETNFGVRDGEQKKVGKTVEIIHKTTEFFVYRFFRPWLHSDYWMPFSSYAKEIVKLDIENRGRLEQILSEIKDAVVAREASKVPEEVTDPTVTKTKTIGEMIIEDQLKNPTFTMEELSKEVYFLIFAGFDTAAHALMWILYSLGCHPEIQEKVLNEISSLDGKEDIQYDDVQDLTYLECVIKEALRKYTIPFLLRVVTKDVQCGEYLVPKNTEVLFFPYMLHRDRNIYPDPEKFDPNRFMDKNSKIKPWNWIPFMDGPRACVGRNYAFLSMKVILVHVLRKFKVISLDRDEDLTFKMSLILCTEEKPRMRFIPRNEQSFPSESVIGKKDASELMNGTSLSL